MKTSLAFGLGLGLAAAVFAPACTVVAPGNPDAGMTTIIPIPLRPVLKSEYPSDDEVLTAILRTVGGG